MASLNLDGSRDGEPSVMLPLDDSAADIQADPQELDGEPKMSKNQLRKLRRRQQWDDKRGDRKIKRKEKRHARTERNREQLKAKMAEAERQGLDPKSVLPHKVKIQTVRVPIAIVIDNDFHKYMREGEFISITSQLTRCYSDNRRAPFCSHLVMSDWKGPMLDRFENALKGTYKNWTNVHFTDKDFVVACEDATRNMQAAIGSDTICESLANMEEPSLEPIIKDARYPGETPLSSDEEENVKNIVYLTAESPNTIDKLEPNTCYVVGGIVDKNREKGLCYRRAKERGIRTAKLPIGEYLQMATRKVLATNHVVEIMLKWLETGDWGKAFLEVIPKRKGGQLKDTEEQTEEELAGANDDAPMEGQPASHEAGGDVSLGDRGDKGDQEDQGDQRTDSMEKTKDQGDVRAGSGGGRSPPVAVP